jgi:hypothetical protein
MPLELANDRGADADGFVPPLIADESFADEIAASVLDALVQFDTFSSVAREGEGSVPADLAVKLRITTNRATQVERIEPTNTVWVNTGLWFLLGLPGWIMDDVRYVQPIEMSYTVTDRKSGEAIFAASIDIGDDNVLNFLRRAGWRQYLLQIVVPPFVTDRIAPDLDRADAALYENYISLIQRSIGGALKRDLTSHLIAQGRPVVLVDSGTRGKKSAAWIFSESAVSSARLRGRGGSGGDLSLSDKERAKPGRFRDRLRKQDAMRIGDYRFHYRVALPDLSSLDSLMKLEVSFEGIGSRSWTLRQR